MEQAKLYNVLILESDGKLSNELEDAIIEVKKTIEKIDNPDYRVLLQLRYIENLTFELIAKRMHISLSTAKKMA